ncbi:MAG TPA: hypothetical protein PK530_25250, partial [Anaerolineales bacterium]|nr:hypothetical protein [Anaerolineales bacterium]
MPSKINEYLQKTEYALQKGDQKTAVSLLNQILQEDLHHAEAWQLLYKTLGQNETSFEAFQKKHVQKYFPQRVSELKGKNDQSIRRVSLTGGKKTSSRDELPPATPEPSSKP